MTRLRALVLAVALVVAGCGGGSSTTGAATVVDAFEDAGLPVPNPRDNSRNCGTLPCRSLISTDSFSVYEWKDEAGAQRWAATSTFHTAVNGRITVTFHTGGSAVEVDPAPYEKVLSGL